MSARYLALAAALETNDEASLSGDTAAANPAPPHEKTLSLDKVASEARLLRNGLDAADDGGPLVDARRRWLRAQLRAIETRARQTASTRLALDAELSDLYDATLSVPDDRDLDLTRRRLVLVLPGQGDPARRLDDFDAASIVPAPRLPAVFERAMLECRKRTRELVRLPDDEQVSIRYVVGEPWSGFSRYEGGNRSVVSVNTSYPLTVDRVLQLACHEGYPGHHVINLLREAQVRGGRPELAAVPLFSPDAYETEAIATHAAALVFSDDERALFERDVLFPIAGLAATDALLHAEVARLVDRLAPSIGMSLAGFLSGERGFVESGWALQQDALMQHPQATLQFASLYRGFALAYTGAAPSRSALAAEWLAHAGFPDAQKAGTHRTRPSNG